LYQFSSQIKDIRKLAQTNLNRKQKARAYKDPEKIIAKIENPVYRTVAEMQLESGARINECRNITEDRLFGFHRDRITDEIKGRIYVQGKGGFKGYKHMKRETYLKIERAVKKKGVFTFSRQHYRKCLKAACKRAGEDYRGSHGLRWNFAQRRFKEARSLGKPYEQALSITSRELFHHRADITEHYLKV